MLRLCDKEICCVAEEQLDRQQFGVETLIPVIDMNRNLLCFAYKDDEADQELRMLDELMEHRSALGFSDIYPQYDSVLIHGSNELAYYFYIYLRKQGILVNVSGDLWEYFQSLQDLYRETDTETIDYKKLEIYGEGIYTKESRLELRSSVSPEFEPIDRIYEANILEGVMKDTEYSIDDILKKLKGKLIALVSKDMAALSVYALNAYDFFLAHGIDICCFVTNVNEGEQRIFGKSVMQRNHAMEKWEDIIFVQVDKKYSAWGSGETNVYHCLGYKRNKRFFLLQDYTELPVNGMKCVLEHWLNHTSGRMVLTGDLRMCYAMQRALEASTGQYNKIVFCDLLGRCRKENIGLQGIQWEKIQKDDYCLLLIPRYYGCCAKENRNLDFRKEQLDKCRAALRQYGITDFLDYPFEDIEWMIAEKVLEGYKNSERKPKRIILGAINFCSGNILFKGVLEEHPDILVMKECILGRNLYSFCVRLSMEPASRIIQTLWDLYDEIDAHGFPGKENFGASMRKLLVGKERFSSQELFVFLHIAYAETLGMEVKNISNMTIYWEPHCVERDEIEHYAEWLDETKSEGYIINIVRNAYIRSGSNVNILEAHRPMDRLLTTVYYPVEDKKEYAHWKRIVMKFEDLKCNPRKEMERFCGETGVEWSDKFLDVQATYKNISGFDLAPVYRTWEEYYSGYDRFRICLAKGPWQKKYGYPYVSSLQFSRRELQEMFLKKFRFEENLVFESNELENIYMKWRQKWMNEILWDVRRKDILERI